MTAARRAADPDIATRPPGTPSSAAERRRAHVSVRESPGRGGNKSVADRGQISAPDAESTTGISSPRAAPATAAEAERRRKRRYRERVRDHRVVVGLDVGEVEIEFLIRHRWLAEADCGDRHQIGRAIAALLADAARR